MKRMLSIGIVIALNGVFSLSSFAQETISMRGMALYENHCTVCHTSQVHIREKRKAKSLEQVEAWVRRWAGELKLAWTDEEVKEVLNYLNSRYYKY